MQTMVRLTPQMPGTVGISAVAGGEEIDDEPSNNPVFITRDVMAAETKGGGGGGAIDPVWLVLLAGLLCYRRSQRRRGRLPGPATAQARQSS